MKSLCLFLCSIIFTLNMFVCSTKIKKLRNHLEENYLENSNFQIVKDIPKNNHLKKYNNIQTQKRINSEYKKFSNETDENFNQTDFIDLKEPSIYRGNCLVKMHNYFYDLTPMSLKKERYIINFIENFYKKITEFFICKISNKLYN